MKGIFGRVFIAGYKRIMGSHDALFHGELL